MQVPARACLPPLKVHVCPCASQHFTTSRWTRPGLRRSQSLTDVSCRVDCLLCAAAAALCLACCRRLARIPGRLTRVIQSQSLPLADFFCLYNGTEGISERSGASLDVYAPPPPVRIVGRMGIMCVAHDAPPLAVDNEFSHLSFSFFNHAACLQPPPSPPSPPPEPPSPPPPSPSPPPPPR